MRKTFCVRNCTASMGEPETILHGCVEISLRNFSSSVEEHFTRESCEQVKYFCHEKRNFISPSDNNNVLFITLINIDEIPNHFTFTPKDAIYYVTIAMVIF